MDDPKTHGEDEHSDINDEQDDIDTDEGVETPADTDDDSNDDLDDPKSDDAEKVAEKQESKWFAEIKSGKKSLEDMPENLGWLKARVEKKLEPEKPKASDLSSDIRKALQEERAEEEFNFLVDDLQNSDIDAEKEAQLRERYEGMISEFPDPTASQKLKVLSFAKEAVGLKDTSESIRERRRKGMSLPPFGSKKRSTVKKGEMTDMEKKFAGDLPPGFKA